MTVDKDYHTKVLFNNCRILKLDDLINLKAIMIMYKAKTRFLAKNIQVFFSDYQISTL